MISGAFSIVKQSIALGCFPRLAIKHTSEKFGGQIYVPAVNWMLMVLTVAVVAGFQSGTAIGNGCALHVISEDQADEHSHALRSAIALPRVGNRLGGTMFMRG